MEKKEIIMKGDGKLYPASMENKKEVSKEHNAAKEYFQYSNPILTRIEKKVNKG